MRTASVREIRGWAPSMPVPNAPHDMLGVMNLRGTVITIIDLARRLGMAPAERGGRSAIIVVEAGATVLGLLVDHVTDMLSIPARDVQPVPPVFSSFDNRSCDGIIIHAHGMICFVNVGRLFERDVIPQAA